MNERQSLLESIAMTTADYRAGELPAPTPEHVNRWVTQFDPDVQLPILREMDHVLKKTYFSRKKVTSGLKSLLYAQEFTGDDPCAFWKSASFLDIQGGGSSQREMLALFDRILKDSCSVGVRQCGRDPKAFVYLDDAIFSGNRVLSDLIRWLRSDAPAHADVHVICMALHCGGEYYADRRIQAAAKAAGKSVDITWWRAMDLEDRRAFTDTSDVLRPVSIPDVPEVQGYVEAMVYKPYLRTPGIAGTDGLFSGEEGRNVLEQEFLKAGVKIRRMCPKLGTFQRPLGNFTLDSLGFGSLFVTFRNCPNNTPLALWAGHPWYPLFRRTTNSQTSFIRSVATPTKGRFNDG
jgi:hypothetical protein